MQNIKTKKFSLLLSLTQLKIIWSLWQWTCILKKHVKALILKSIYIKTLKSSIKLTVGTNSSSVLLELVGWVWETLPVKFWTLVTISFQSKFASLLALIVTWTVYYENNFKKRPYEVVNISYDLIAWWQCLRRNYTT